MRQVDRPELVWRLAFALSRLPAALRLGLTSREPDKRRQAERMVAERLHDGALARLEILSDTPEPPPFRDDAAPGCP